MIKKYKGIERKSLERALIGEDYVGILSKINAVIDRLGDEAKKFHFYFGATSKDERKRLTAHAAKHKTPYLKVISINVDFQKTLFEELLGILYLKSIVGTKIKGNWNKTRGYDSKSLFLAGRQAIATGVYLLWTENPFIPHDHSVGALRTSVVQVKRTPGKFYDLNDGSLREKLPSRISLHMRDATRQNVDCNLCNAKLTSENAEKLHKLQKHRVPKTSFKCRYCKKSGSFNEMKNHESNCKKSKMNWISLDQPSKQYLEEFLMLNKKALKAEDPLYLRPNYTATVKNKGVYSAFMYKGDIEQGSSADRVPVWMFTGHYTFTRAEEIPSTNINGPKIFKILNEVSII